MDLYRKMNENLEPVCGPLFVDRFAVAVAEVAERKAKREAEEQARLAAEREATREAARAAREESAAAREPARRESAAAGGLGAEVEEFMTRDTVEGADDTEIQEFLRERRGFDPTELD